MAIKRPPPRRDAVPAKPARTPRHGLARTLSKLGACSRTQAAQYAREGRVTINGRVVRDPETPVDVERDRIALDGHAVGASERIYLALNKPRGYVTTAADEHGRETVYALLDGAGLPWVAPVGRLDKASEGLLLLTNDSAWAARITAPESAIEKTYHVQIDRLPDAVLLASLARGVGDRGEHLSARSVRELRRGEKHAWLEIVLDEGRNRQIRRLLAAHGIGVMRLLRVAIGSLVLGELGKGAFRRLGAAEVAMLVR
jgi:23S rRNA pseudouridine2605 synthase